MSVPIITKLRKILKRQEKFAANLPKPLAVWFKRLAFFGAGITLGLILVPSLAYAGFTAYYKDRVVPGVSVAGVNLSGRTYQQSLSLLENAVSRYQTSLPFNLTYQDKVWLAPEPEAVSFDPQPAVDKAIKTGKVGPLTDRLKEQWQLWRQGSDLPLTIILDETWLNQFTASLSASLDTEAVPPSVTAAESQSTDQALNLTVNRGQLGRSINTGRFSNNLKDSLAYLRPLAPEIPVETTGIELNQTQADTFKNRAQVLWSKSLVLQSQNGLERKWTLTREELISFLDFEQGFDRQKLTDYLEKVAEVVDRPPQNAKFSFNPATQSVTEFVPAKQGLVLSLEATLKDFEATLYRLEAGDEVEPVLLTLTTSEPEIDLDKANDLGIKELLGRGESTYVGSIPSRIHNVALAAARIKGTLVKPGEVFSFNQAVGEISAATGYQSAYVISGGRTVLGDGGGVCQDSTTIFRAALDAGLPIVERRGHSYRVGYYEQNADPGLDATVYAPYTDFKFKNDTPGYILIDTIVDSARQHLVIEIYGTSDGRQSQITNHQLWGTTPPPPDVYVDDPTLPFGTVKQVDWKAWGAKTKFDYKVTRNGETLIEETYYTTYKSWAAVFLRGTLGAPPPEEPPPPAI